MDNMEAMIFAAAKVLSAKLMTLVLGGLSIAFSLIIWFSSRMVANQDLINANVQEMKITQAVNGQKMTELSDRVQRLATFMRENLPVKRH